MRSTFHGLEVARRGLYAQQTAISTTGHNIANANTQGYSRQRVNFTSATAIDVPGLNRTQTPGQLGTGVTFSSIERIRESFLDDQFRNEAGSHGAWSVQQDVLEKIEFIFGEPGDTGMSSVIDEFWNGWQELSKDPESLEARAVVKERSQALLDVFQHTDRKLSELNQDLSTDLEVKLTQANTYIEQIAQLNGEIRRIEGIGDHANDLRDQRDVLVDKLAGLAQIEVEESEGMYKVSLVVDDGAEDIVLVDENGDHLFKTDENDGEIDREDVTGGEIYGIIQGKAIVEDYQNQLETMFDGLINGEVDVHIPTGSVLARDLVDSEGNVLVAQSTVVEEGGIYTVQGINGLLQLGWTLREDDNKKAHEDGLFVLVDESSEEFSIQNIQLNPEIEKDPGMIPASLRVEIDESDELGEVVKGNGDLALIMAQLRDSQFNFGTSENEGEDPVENGNEDSSEKFTFDEYFRSVLGQLGVQTQEATRQTDNQTVIMNAVDQRRMSVSGVSLDEEMTNLIQFQHAYNASARMMTTIDQLLETIINRMGVVGR